MRIAPCRRPGPLWFLRFLLGMGCAVGATAQAQDQETERAFPPLAERNVIRVGATNDSYPYGYVGPNGEWTGFTGELLSAVQRVMNLRMERVLLPGQEVQERFRTGEFDMLQALSQTPARENYADFSVPFLTLQGTLFVRKGSDVHTLDDLNGRTFAVIGRQSIAEKFLREHGLRVDIVYVSSTEDGLRLVETGAAVATFASNLTALSVIQRAGFSRITVLGDPYPGYDIRHCFVVHKGDAELLARLNEGLAILHASGEFDALYDRWFGRLGGPLISRQKVVTYAIWALGLAFLAAFGGLLQQRALRQRIAGQAAELAEQKALLQALYDNMPSAMCVLGVVPEGHRVLTLNRQAAGYFARAVDDVTGRLLADLAPESEWTGRLLDLLQKGLTTRRLWREETVLKSTQQRIILTLVPMSPDAVGQTRLCVLAEDVTERRNLDNEIARSRKLRAVGELVGGIAHEFNNLLTPIMLKVGQIQLDWAHDPELLAETRLIADAVQRSAELTQRLLTFGRHTDQKMELVRLGPLVSNCFSLMRLTMDRRILWEQAIPEDLPPLCFSATNLNQIILNLIINARDTLLEKLAAQRGEWLPVIRIEAKLLPVNSVGRVDGTTSSREILGWQRLSISDTGMGMAPDVRERIFEPFFTTKEVGKGTGLGLATVWHLITEVSGRIEVESEPGVGTTFHLYLPMLPAPASVMVNTPPALPPNGVVRVFLAEDDQSVARAIMAALGRHKHPVRHFTDGAESWQHLQTHAAEYDLMILDVNMPGLDGIELARRVRAGGGYAGRIMIASGRLTSDDLQEIADAKVDHVLKKPFAVAELLAAVRESLEPRAE